jgi:hypothetical protein
MRQAARILSCEGDGPAFSMQCIHLAVVRFFWGEKMTEHDEAKFNFHGYYLAVFVK